MSKAGWIAAARAWLEPRAGVWLPLGRHLRGPVRSLSTRLVAAGFAATLVTSLVVTWISVSSTKSFLDQKIARQFPAILRGASERLDLWYSQRRLDIETFARSATAVESLRALSSATSPGGSRRHREELKQYLTYVLKQFPQYQALFALDTAGRPLLWVGAEPEPGSPLLGALAAVEDARVGAVHEFGGHAVQVISSPVDDDRSRRLGSLHALAPVHGLAALLRSQDVGESGGLYVVDASGRVLARSPRAPELERYERSRSEDPATPRVERYTNALDLDVVGSAMRFDRFGWTLVVEQAYDEAFAPVVVVIRRILAINLGIVLVFSLVAFQIARSIVRPIRALSEGALRIASGETDVAIPTTSTAEEIEVLTRTFNEMASRLRENQAALDESRIEIEDANARLIAQNQELQRVNEVFEQLSITDGLTKIHNHRFFQEQLPREMKRSLRTGAPLSLILVDIDDFKALNDRYGHAVGDVVLRRVAEVMGGVIRDIDLLARYGGEEFALLVGQTPLEGAVALAEKLRLAVSNARFPIVDLKGPNEISVTVSIGVAPFRGDQKAFFNEADGALYRAKRSGKDCVVVAGD